MVEAATQGLSEKVAEQVLALDLFQALPPATKRRVTQFARVHSIPGRTDVIQQGEFTSDFHIVLRGLVAGFRTDDDGQTRRIVELAPGQWFGELSALSNQPSPARLFAEVETTVLTLDSGLFKDVYRSARSFRARIDEQYRETSLEIHLAVVPALRSLRREDLAKLRDVSAFEIVEEGTEIASAGEAVRDVLLVRSGAVTREVRTDDGGSTTDGYLMVNSSFGEESLWSDDARWSRTYVARTDVELVRLPAQDVREALGEDSPAMRALADAAREVSRADEGALHADERGAMLGRGSVKGGEALVIDLEKCVRCNACVESCVAVHDDGIPRLSKSGFRVAPEANNAGKPLALVTSCYHCQMPGCMMACSYGAIRRDPQGLIRILPQNCVGCAMCVDACPYDVIRLTDPEEALSTKARGLASLPVVGKLFGGARTPVSTERVGYHKEDEAKGKAVKCDRCEGLPFEACVYNCPCGAIERREPSSLFGDRDPRGGV